MFSFWRGNGDWLGYKATTMTAFTGALKALVLDNNWVFTSVPMAGQSESDAGSKFFYALAQLLAGAFLWGNVGLLVDYARSIYAKQHPTENTPFQLR